MTKPAPEYELVLMLDPEVPDERRDQIAVEARRRIEDGADLKQERSWGLRKMAYEINQRTEADYRFFRFGEGAPVLDELNHNLKITDGVLRFRIFKVDPRSPVIDPPPPFSLAATAAPRPGGRRRDDDRPPRGPDPAAGEGSEETTSEPPQAAPAEATPEPASAEAASEPPADPEPPAEAETAAPETAPEPEAPAADAAAEGDEPSPDQA